MKIEKGKIKNISKKLVTGALMFSLVMVPLTGCDSISIDNINYSTNEQGKIGFTINDKDLQYCSFYEVYDNKSHNMYYTIGFRDEFNGSYFIKIYDVFTKKELKISEYSFRSVKLVKEYLNEQNISKDEYTELDLKDVLNSFSSKQKVKSK